VNPLDSSYLRLEFPSIWALGVVSLLLVANSKYLPKLHSFPTIPIDCEHQFDPLCLCWYLCVL